MTEGQASPEGRRLRDALQALADKQLHSGFAIAAGPLSRFANVAIFDAEIGANAQAHPRRWATFRGGRACAREALSVLGQPAVAIPSGPAGEPRWPKGFVGSITHTDAFSAAIVARSPPVVGLGLDLDDDTALDDPKMLELICRPEEIAINDANDPAHRTRGKLLFVIKEAVYKLYQPATGSFLEFQDVSVVIDETTCTFGAVIVNPELPAVAGSRKVAGSYVHVEGLFLALASLF